MGDLNNLGDLRPMTPDDVPAVLAIQAECYEPALIEDEPSIRARLDVSPDSAWVVEDDAGVCAYLVAYRSVLGKITPLGGAFAVAVEPAALYLHDLAVARRVRGRGVAQALVSAAGEQARAEGLAHASLVCVQAAREFWQKHGYAVVSVADPRQSSHLASYGDRAHYMVKRLHD